MSRELADLSGYQLAFWSRGNGPTQEVFDISAGQALLHLKALYLLADRVLAAASFFFESSLTRQVFANLEGLFRAGEILFFVDATLESFSEHGQRKIEKSPASFEAYADPMLVARLAGRLDAAAELLWRPDVNASSRIEELWIKDIYSSTHGTIGAAVMRYAPSVAVQRIWRSALVTASTQRDGDLVWPLIMPRLVEAQLPREIIVVARRRLAQMYSRVTADLVGARSDAAYLSLPNSTLTTYDCEDTALLLDALGAARLGRALARLDGSGLRSVKLSAEWVYFRSLYRALVEEASVNPGELLEFIGVLDGQELSGAGLTREQFVALFGVIGTTNRPHPNRFESAVDILRAAYELFPAGLLDGLRSRLDEVEHERNDTTPIIIRRTQEMDTGLRSFIVHGHDETKLLALKDFLQNGLGWGEPIVLKQQPNRGRTIIEKFEELGERVDVAFVLMTPDDAVQTDDGERFRMRQNVLYELGYFVGRFGRKSGRTIFLHGGSLDMPTDLAGVAYIDVSEGIEAAAERIRTEVAGLRRRRSEG